MPASGALVALRGDLPSGAAAARASSATRTSWSSSSASETGDWFHIDVAALPGVPPAGALGRRTTSRAFVRKVDAGAELGDHAVSSTTPTPTTASSTTSRRWAARVPIVPGHHADHELLAARAASPKSLRHRHAALDRRAPRRATATIATSIRAFGLDVVTDLCAGLLARGAPGLHFYSMNQAPLTDGDLAAARPDLTQ